MAIKKITSKNSKYFGKYRVRVEPVINGAKVFVPVQYADNKRQADLLQSQLILEAKKGLDYKDADLPLSKAFSNFIKKQKKMGRWTDSTYASWQCTSKIVKKYSGRLKIKDCNEETMRALFHSYVNDPKRHAKVTPNGTVAKMMVQLRCFFKTLVGSSIKASQMPIPANRPLDTFFRLDEQLATPKKYIFSDQELKNFLHLIKKDLHNCEVKNSGSRLAAWIQAETGIRTQEVQALRFSDFDSKRRCFILHDSFSEQNNSFNHHLKGRKPGDTRETLPISDDLVKMISSFKQRQKKFLKVWGIINKEDLIFLNLTDKRLAKLNRPLTQRSLNSMVQSLAKRAGVKTKLHISCYTLRRTAASKIARISTNYPLDAERLGHSLAIFMKVYVKPDHSEDDLVDENWIDKL